MGNGTDTYANCLSCRELGGEVKAASTCNIPILSQRCIYQSDVDIGDGPHQSPLNFGRVYDSHFFKVVFWGFRGTKSAPRVLVLVGLVARCWRHNGIGRWCWQPKGTGRWCWRHKGTGRWCWRREVRFGRIRWARKGRVARMRGDSVRSSSVVWANWIARLV